MLEWKVWSLAYKILIAKIKRVPKKASIWEFKINIFVSSEIRQMNSNLHISVSEAKLIRIAVVVNTTFPQSFFPFESVKSHEGTQLAQKNIKWNEANRKVVKKSAHFSSMESKWSGRWLAYWWKQLLALFKTFWLPDCFSGILYILLAWIVKISYEVKIFIKLSVCISL